MNLLLQMFVPGLPATQGSKRHVGRGIMVDSCKRLAPWRNLVAFTAAACTVGVKPCDTAVAVQVTFYLPRPAGHYGTGRNASVLKATAPAYPLGKPDTSKMFRAVEDAMSGVVYTDDCRVVEIRAAKRYADETTDNKPGARVRVWVVDEQDEQHTKENDA